MKSEEFKVIFNLRISKTTKNVELDALKMAKGLRVLGYFVLLKDPKRTTHLTLHLPHMWNPNLITDLNLKVSAWRLTQSLHGHQRYALEALRRISQRIFFMTGCPGAGKTNTATFFTVLAQITLYGPRTNKSASVFYISSISTR